MKKTIAAALLLVASAQPSMAEDCAERMARILIESLDAVSARGYIVSEIKGGQTTENEFLLLTWEHYLYKPIEPPDGPWLLTYDGTTYQSSDEGVSWTAAYSFDKEEMRAANIASVTAQAETVRNAVCGEEELNGEMHDTVEADLTNPEPYPYELHNKYWLDQRNGFVMKSTSHVVSPNFESFTTQTWTHVGGMLLPVPE